MYILEQKLQHLKLNIPCIDFNSWELAKEIFSKPKDDQ